MRRLAPHLFTLAWATVRGGERLTAEARRRFWTARPFSPMPRLAARLGVELAAHLIDRARRERWRSRWSIVERAVHGIVGAGIGVSISTGRHDVRAVAIGLPLAIWYLSARVRVRQSLREVLRDCGHCPACGCDLRASPARCPECGMHAGAEVNT